MFYLVGSADSLPNIDNQTAAYAVGVAAFALGMMLEILVGAYPDEVAYIVAVAVRLAVDHNIVVVGILDFVPSVSFIYYCLPY